MKVIDTGEKTASENMAYDEALLEGLEEGGEPILHLYDWKDPSVTCGYFVKWEEYIDLVAAKRHGLDLAKRPTGGGIVFHLWDLAFSFLMPAGHFAFSRTTLDNYQFVNRAVLAAVQAVFPLKELTLTPDDFAAKSSACSRFCMARPTQYDVIYQGLKLAGAAQRRRKQGYLHQGTISLSRPDPALLKEVLLDPAVFEAVLAHSFISPLPLDQARAQMKKSLVEHIFTSVKELPLL